MAPPSLRLVLYRLIDYLSLAFWPYPPLTATLEPSKSRSDFLAAQSLTVCRWGQTVMILLWIFTYDNSIAVGHLCSACLWSRLVFA